MYEKHFLLLCTLRMSCLNIVKVFFCESVFAVKKKLCQCLSDSCWLSSILCPSFCYPVVLKNSLSWSLIGLTMLLTHIVESAACTYDGRDSGDVHIQPFPQASPPPLSRPNVHSTVTLALLCRSLKYLCCAVRFPASVYPLSSQLRMGYAGSPSSMIGTWTPLISTVSFGDGK